MHEYHLVEALVRAVEEKARQQRAARVLKVSLAVGDRAGLEEGAIRLYFETIAAEGPAAGAEIALRTVRDSGEFYVDSIEIETA